MSTVAYTTRAARKTVRAIRGVGAACCFKIAMAASAKDDEASAVCLWDRKASPPQQSGGSGPRTRRFVSLLPRLSSSAVFSAIGLKTDGRNDVRASGRKHIKTFLEIREPDGSTRPGGAIRDTLRIATGQWGCAAHRVAPRTRSPYRAHTRIRAH